jgi:hypothetical protein
MHYRDRTNMIKNIFLLAHTWLGELTIACSP